ncbi:Antagonist of MEN (Mitotic Exit Network) [Entomortierella beljakovae]|nr:Antagonist of MEN (Mitotic Exit Network) [Entomortierella beljakovae]
MASAGIPMNSTADPEDGANPGSFTTASAISVSSDQSRFHRHTSSTSSCSVSQPTSTKSHRRRFSIQSSTSSTSSISQRQPSRSHQQTANQFISHNHTQSAAATLTAPSPSFFRRIFKAFVGNSNSIETHGFDPCSSKVHPLEGRYSDACLSFEDSQSMETQTDESVSSEECECSCGDPHTSHGGMMTTTPGYPQPEQQSNSSSRHKKRSNSTVTASSANSAYSQGGRSIKSSRPGRQASLGDSSSDYNSSSSGMGARRASVTSSIAGESIHYDLGSNSKNRSYMKHNQQYRQHFTGHSSSMSSTTSVMNPTHQDIVKRRMSFFKSVATAGAGSSSRRGSAFSTKSQETAVNLTGINLADEFEGESEDDDETEDMNLDDEEESFDDSDGFYDYYNECDELVQQDYYSTNDKMLTDDVEMDLHRLHQERSQQHAYAKHSDRIRSLRKQSLLSDKNNLVYKNRIGGVCAVHQRVVQTREQRLSPLQLPEILHLILQFVVDMTPTDDYSQREIHNCLLVSKQWYLVAQKTLWREIRLKNPEKLEIFVDLLKRTEEVEYLGIEKNNAQFIQGQGMNMGNLVQQQHRRNSNKPYEEESIMSSNVMQKRLHERALGVKKVVLHKLKLIEDKDILPLTTWFHNLQILEFYICEKLTDKIVISVAENCPQLQQLLMPGCAKITDASITQVALHCPRMKHLDLRACSNVSDESLILVAKYCPDLWHLNVGRVSSSSKVTGKSIVEIAKNTKLNTLGLAGCAMTDEAVIEIARYSRSGLHRISLNCCPMLTSASIKALMQLCPSLAVLEIKQCLLVSDMATLYRFSTRRVLVELCPELQKRLLEYKVELAAMNASIQSNNIASTQVDSNSNNNNNNNSTNENIDNNNTNAVMTPGQSIY